MRRVALWWAAGATSVAYIALGAVAIASGEFTLNGILYLLLTAPVFVASAAYIMWRRPESRAGDLLMAVALLAMGVPNLLQDAVLLRVAERGQEAWMWLPLWVTQTSTVVGTILASALIALLPDGRIRYAHERYFGIAAIAFGVLPTVTLLTHRTVPMPPSAPAGLHGIGSPMFIPALEPLGPVVVTAITLSYLFIAFGIFGLFVRYRRGTAREQRQLRWVLLAGTLVVALTIVPTTLDELGLLPGFQQSGWAYVTFAPALLLPLSIVGAVTEPPWIDIDFVIRRSFVLGTVSLIILAIYVAVAAAIGLAVGSELPIGLAVVLTVVVAIALQPVRDRLQRLADRWVFGVRPSGYETLATFGSTMTDVSRPSEVVDQLATSARQALRLSWAMAIVPGFGSRTVGEARGEAALELQIGGPDDGLGRLVCGEPLVGSLGPDEVALARALVGQAASAIANARLAARIVEAQEEERSRIERNLHDGAQQELVALVAQLSLVRSMAGAGTLRVSTIDELQMAVRSILNDIRELAQGISPSIVRDAGIVAAVEERCARLPIDVTLRVEPTLRRARFPAQIEGAAYFLVAEALANVLKHAHATHARVSLQQQEAGLAVTVADDGNGFDPSANRGSGLAGLEDRIAALGGTMQVTSRPATGTLVTAVIPVTA